jgi:hypothetical protein
MLVRFTVTLDQEICQVGALPFSRDTFNASWLDHPLALISSAG